MRYRTWKAGRLIVGLGTAHSDDHRDMYEKVATWHNAGLPVRDDAYYDHLRHVVIRKGTLSRLWGTSSRDLDRAVEMLLRQASSDDRFTEGAVTEAAVLLATCRQCRNRMGYLGARDAERYAFRRLLTLHMDHAQHGSGSDADTDEPRPN